LYIFNVNISIVVLDLFSAQVVVSVFHISAYWRPIVALKKSIFWGFERNPLSFEIPIDRSLGRNVHFYDTSAPDVSLGGLTQNSQ